MVQIERDFGLFISGVEIPPEYNPASGAWLAGLIRGVLPAAVGSAVASSYYWTVHPFGGGYVHIGHLTTTGATFRFGITALLAPAGTLTAPYGGVSAAIYNMYNPTNPDTQQPASPMHYVVGVNTTELYCQVLVESHTAGHTEGDDRFSSTYADLIGFTFVTPYELFVAVDERPAPSRTLWRSSTATGTITSGETPEGIIGLNAWNTAPDTLVGAYVGSGYETTVPYAIAAPTVYGDSSSEPCIGVSTLLQKVQTRYNPDVKQPGFWQDAPYDRLFDPSRPDLAFVPIPTSLTASTQSMYVMAVPRDPFVGVRDVFTFAASVEEADAIVAAAEVVADAASTGLIETTLTAIMQTLSVQPALAVETSMTAQMDNHDIFSRYTWSHAFDALDLGHPWANSGVLSGDLESTEEWSTSQPTDALAAAGIGPRVDGAVRTAVSGMTPYLGTNAYLGPTPMTTGIALSTEAYTLRTVAKFEEGEEGGVFFAMPPRSALAVGWTYATQSYPTLNGQTRNASIGITKQAVILRSEFNMSTDSAGNVLGAPAPIALRWPRMPVGWALIDVNVTSETLVTRSDVFVLPTTSSRVRLAPTAYSPFDGWWYQERVWDIVSISGGASMVRDIDYVIEAQIDGDYIRFTPQAGRAVIPTSTPVTISWYTPGATTVEAFVNGSRYALELPYGFRAGSLTNTAIGWNQVGTWLFTGCATTTRSHEDHLIDVAACGL